jgi:hypothetical protein
MKVKFVKLKIYIFLQNKCYTIMDELACPKG